MRWSYKTVHYELKKEGLLGGTFLDESEVERSLNEYGKAGWELVSILETMDGLIAVFKQVLSFDDPTYSPRQREVGEMIPTIADGPVTNGAAEEEGGERKTDFDQENGLHQKEIGGDLFGEQNEGEKEETEDVGSIRIE